MPLSLAWRRTMRGLRRCRPGESRGRLCGCSTFGHCRLHIPRQ